MHHNKRAEWDELAEWRSSEEKEVWRTPKSPNPIFSPAISTQQERCWDAMQIDNLLN
jgi:hypothetical protein